MVKETKPNKVYEDLKTWILTFKLKPGQAIGEVDIAQQFNVSRTPVRDAFKRLEADGLIEVKSHIGTYVTLIDVNQIADAIFIREHIEKAIISELCQNYKISLNMRINYILSAQEKLLENVSEAVFNYNSGTLQLSVICKKNVSVSSIEKFQSCCNELSKD